MISWLYRKGGYGMIKVLEVLLRSNFRCGRMLYSRADAVVGCFRAPSWHRDHPATISATR